MPNLGPETIDAIACFHFQAEITLADQNLKETYHGPGEPGGARRIWAAELQES